MQPPRAIGGSHASKPMHHRRQLAVIGVIGAQGIGQLRPLAGQACQPFGQRLGAH